MCDSFSELLSRVTDGAAMYASVQGCGLALSTPWAAALAVAEALSFVTDAIKSLPRSLRVNCST